MIVQQFFCKMLWLSSEYDIEIWECGHHFVLAHIPTSSTITLTNLHLKMTNKSNQSANLH